MTWDIIVYIFAVIGAIGIVARLLHFHKCECGYWTWNCNAFIAHIETKHSKKKR